MNFTVQAKSQADFDAWVAKMKAPATVPATAQKGEELFKENCMSCHAVNANGPGVAPNLKGFADRDTTCWYSGTYCLRKWQLWIHNPQDRNLATKCRLLVKKQAASLMTIKLTILFSTYRL